MRHPIRSLFARLRHRSNGPGANRGAHHRSSRHRLPQLECCEPRLMLAAYHVSEPVADAYVDSQQPQSNFGDAPRLITRGPGTAAADAFVRFDLDEIGELISGATARLYPTQTTDTGLVNRASVVLDSTWSESALTFDNKPPSGSIVGTWVAVAGVAVELDVTAAVQSVLDAYATLPGDMDTDRDVDLDDVSAFITGLISADAYAAEYGIAPEVHGDVNGDGRFDLDDVEPFVSLLTAPTPAPALSLRIDVPPGAGGSGEVHYGSRESGEPALRPRLVIATPSSDRVIDFEADATRRPLEAGDIIAEQWSEWGVHITADPYGNQDHLHPLMIFDSANPPGIDFDLGTPNEDFGGPGIGAGGQSGQPGENSIPLGNLLILSQDGDPAVPDDYDRGGTITFSFDDPVTLDGLQFVDIEQASDGRSTVSLFDADNTLISSHDVPILGNNSAQRMPFGVPGVRRMDIFFPSLYGSASLAEVSFTPSDTLLVEQTSFVVDHRQSIVVPDDPQVLAFGFSGLTFDHTDPDSINDAFEAALVDAGGRPVVGTIGQGRDAFFNVTEGESGQPPLVLLGGGTQYDAAAGQVMLDVSHLVPGTPLTLVTRLVNNDGVAANDDTTTQVHIAPGVSFLGASAISISPTLATPITPASPPRQVDPNHLADVTASVQLQYARTSFGESQDRLYAGVQLAHDGVYPVRGPILLGVKNISHPLARLAGAQGVTRSGMPYYDITHQLLADPLDVFGPGEVSSTVDLSFFNPDRVRFDYDLVVLGFLNTEPQFDSEPRTDVVAGMLYEHAAHARDDDGDPLVYSVQSAPTGLDVDPTTGSLTWDTANVVPGGYPVLLKVEDPYGGFDFQAYTIHVTTGVPNRSPRFTSEPVVDAYVGEPFPYASTAFDADGDELAFSLANVQWPGPFVPGPGEELTMTDVDNPEQGLVAWTPAAALVGQLVRLTERVVDGREGEAERTWDVYVHTQPGNDPPVIISTPPVRWTLPGFPGPASGNVDPDRLDLDLAPGETENHTVSIGLVQGVPQADIFLLVDDTFSFENAAPGFYTGFEQTLDELILALPDTDIGFGVGRFEDYSTYDSNLYGRPFILNQPILPSTAPDFEAIVAAALVRAAPGQGGDWPETLIEALYQTATGHGFDSNANATTSDSGRAGSIQTQINPGESGDVPSFDTFDPAVYFGFRILDATQLPVLPTGSLVTGSLDAGRASSYFQFTASAGQRLLLDSDTTVSGPWIDSHHWTVFGPDNTTIESRPLTENMDVTLPDDGLYVLQLAADMGPHADPIALQFHTFAPPTTTRNLAIGQPVAGTLAEPGQIDQYAFELSEDGLLLFDSQTSDGGFLWSLDGPLGSVVSRANLQGNDAGAGLDADRLLELPHGFYTLSLFDPWTATGDYAFELIDLAAALPFVPSIPNTGTLDPGNATDTYRLEVPQKGDQFAFSASHSGNTHIVWWELVDPYGDLVFSTSMAADHTVTLDAAGSYTLVVQGNLYEQGVVDYSFQADYLGNDPPETPPGQPLVLNVATQGVISQTGQQDHYSFTLQDDSLLYFDALAGDYAHHWSLAGPTGPVVSTRSFGDSDGSSAADSITVLDLPDGDYLLTIESFGSTADYAFNLMNLDTAAVPFSPGTPVSGTLDPGSATHVYRFTTADADERFYFDAQNAPFTSVYWRLVDPYARVLFGNYLDDDEPTQSLPFAGSYLLLVEGYLFDSGTKDYQFNVQPEVISSQPALELNTPTTGMITIPGERVEYPLTVGPETRLYFDSLTDTGQFEWSFRGPQGEVVTRRPLNHVDDPTSWIEGQILSAPVGSYTLSFQAAADQAGDFSFALWDLVAGGSALETDTQSTGSLDPGNQTVVYRLDFLAGDQVDFDLTVTSDINAFAHRSQWQLLDPFGDAVWTERLNADVGPVTLTSDGPYTLLIEGPIDAAGDRLDYEFEARHLAYAPSPLTTATLDVGQTYVGPLGMLERLQFSINATAEQRLFYDGLIADGRVSARMSAPSQFGIFHLPAMESVALEDQSQDDRGPWTVSEPGDQRLTFQPTEVPTAVGPGLLGGAGFRPGALPIILAATDATIAYQFDGADTIVGVDGVQVPLSELAYGEGFRAARGATPGGRGATIQDTVDALIQLGALVVGLGAEPSDPTSIPSPAGHLQALARLTGAVDVDGQPLYATIDLANPRSLKSAVKTAVQSAINDVPFDVRVQSSNPDVLFQNLSGLFTDVLPGSTAVFDVAFTGDGNAYAFQLQFVHEGTGALLGSIPVTLGGGYQYPSRAIDADGDILTYRLLGSDHGAEIDAQTGIIDWVPASTGEFPFTLQVSDGRGGSDTQSWTVTVGLTDDGNQAPTVQPIPNQSTDVGRAMTVSVRANDPDQDPLSYYLLGPAAGGTDPVPAGMTIDRHTGRIDWTPPLAEVGLHNVTVLVTDRLGGQTTLQLQIDVQLPTRFGNSHPTIGSRALAAALVGQLYRYDIMADDLDGDPLTYSVSLGPAGMTIDASDGVLVWRPQHDQIGSHRVVIRVADPFGGRAFESVDLVVSAENVAPRITGEPPLAVQDLPWSFRLRADDPNGDIATLRLDSGPPGMAFDPAEPDLLRWDAPPAAGTFFFEVAADDGRGGGDRKLFQLTVLAPGENGVPQIEGPPVPAVILGQPYVYGFTVSDPNADPVQVLLDPTAFDLGISLVQGSGDAWQLAWGPNDQRPGTFRVAVIADDMNDGFATATFELEVVPAESGPPRWTALPESAVARDVRFQFQLAAEDPDGGPVTFSPVALPADMSLSPGGLLDWTPTDTNLAGQAIVQLIIRASDDEGQSTDATIDLPVVLNTAPRITSQPTRITDVNLPYEYNRAGGSQVVLEDPNPDDTHTFSLSVRPADSNAMMDSATGEILWTPGTPGIYDVRIVARDQAGAAGVQEFSLHVIDTSGPNRQPTIDPASRTTVQAGQLFLHQVVATDADFDPIVDFDLLGGPPGMSIDPLTGVILWTPAMAQIIDPPASPYVFQVQVTDGRGAVSGAVPFAVNVVREWINTAPAVLSVPRLSAPARIPYHYLPMATDADRDPLRWQLERGPEGMSIDSHSGRIEWTPRVDQLGDHRVQIRVADPYGGSTPHTFVLSVLGANRPPQIDAPPLPQATIGELYAFDVPASDPDGHAIQFALEVFPGREFEFPVGMTIDPASGRIAWPQPAGETFAALLRVTDEHAASSWLGFGGPVIDPATGNRPPTIDSDPIYFGQLGRLYQYDVNATDPDEGDELSWTPTQMPAGMTIDSTGRITWPASAVTELGRFPVAFTVSDATVSVLYSYQLTILDAGPLVIDPIPNQQIDVGSLFAYDVRATDPAGLSVDFDLSGSPPIGMGIDALGRIRWPVPGVHPLGTTGPVSVDVTDALGRTASATFHIDVLADTTPPQVHIQVSDPAPPVGSLLTVFVLATDNVGVQTLRLTGDGQELLLDAAGTATITVDATGPLALEATATDVNGNTSDPAAESVFVTDPHDVSDPQVRLITPGDGQRITAPIDVIGTVTDPDTPGVAYRLEIAPIGTADFIPFASGAGNVTGGVLNSPDEPLDPTLLDNGMYIVRLSASDDGFTTVSSDTAVVEVAGRLKLGNLALSFTDLQIPLAGIPITVGRSYDSLRADRQGDFGYGWQLDLASISARTDFGDGPRFGLDHYRPFINGTRVTVRMPDGTNETFEFQAVPAAGLANTVFYYAPTFRPLRSGVTSTLSVPFVELRPSNLGNGTYLASGTSYSPLDPRFGNSYTLTLRDGVQMVINATSGELAEIVDRNGNRLEFLPQGIVSSTGGSVAFKRDAVGRIVEVVDPAAQSITYDYDPLSGDLVHVTNREGQSTRFEYFADDDFNPTQAHILKAVYQGIVGGGEEVLVLRAMIDPDTGRLSGLSDAADKPLGLQYQLDLGDGRFLERITDATGVPTELVRDDRGNVLRHIVRLEENLADPDRNRYIVTLFRYDPLDNPTHRSRPFEVVGHSNRIDEVPDPLPWSSQTEYDDAGNLLTVLDPLGAPTFFAYDPAGNRTHKVGPGGETTAWQFDGNGNLLSMQDDNGTQTLLNTVGPRGEVLTSANSAGMVIAQYGYDRFGNVTSTTDAAGVTSTMDYDENGNQEQFSHVWTDPLGVLPDVTVQVQDMFDAEGRKQQSTGPTGQSLQYGYDALGNLVRQTDDDGDQQLMTYDVRGHLIQTEFADGTVTRIAYDDNGRAEFHSVRHVPGDAAAVTRSVYDNLGRVMGIERMEAAVIELQDDPDHLQPDGTPFKKTELTTGWAPEFTSTTSYDAAGQVTASTTPSGLTTRYEYDAAGRQTAVIHPGVLDTSTGQLIHHRVETTYDAAGRVLAVRDRIVQRADGTFDDTLARETQYRYDNLGRLTRTIYPDRSETSVTYNALGQRQSATDPLGRTTDYEYDPLGRLTAVILPAVDDPYNPGQLVRPRYEYGYDDYGNRTTIRDNLAQIGDVVRVDHNPQDGNPDESRTTRWTFDALGQQTSRTLPGGQQETFAYENGLLRRHTDFDGRIAETIYDGLGMTDQVRYFSAGSDPDAEPPDEVIDYLFGQLGRLEQVTDARGLTEMLYEDDLLGEIRGPAGSLHYAYDPDHPGRLVQVLAGDDPLSPETATEYVYDALGRLERVRKTAGNGAVLPLDDQPETLYGYDPLSGHLQTVTYPNGAVARYTYDVIDRIERLVHYAPDATPGTLDDNPVLAAFDYTYRTDSLPDSVTESRPDRTTVIRWQYDALGRMIEEWYDSTDDGLDYRTTYRFDLVGNRLEKATDRDGDLVADEVVTYGYDENDRLLSETESVAAAVTRMTTYAYGPTELLGQTVTDASGDVIERVTNTYNLQGRLATSTAEQLSGGDVSSRTVTAYQYDHSGARVSRHESMDADADGQPDSVTETFYWVDARNPTGYHQVLFEAQYDDAATPNRLRAIEYTTGLDVVAQSTVVDSAESTIYLHPDAKGSTRLVTDGMAEEAERYDFDAYGNLLVPITSPLTTLLYNGEPFDGALGGYYLRARYYNPATGRFNRLDPFPGDASSPQTLHKYAFAGGNPIANADPTGLFSIAGLSIGGALRAGFRYSLNAYAFLTVGGALRQLVLGNQTVSQIIWQPRVEDHATLITHGVAGLPLVAGATHPAGWSNGFQTALTDSGLGNTDFVEFTWSGFDISGLGVVPNIAVHNLAILSYRSSLHALWTKGYDNLNIISHSWGTVLSYDLLDNSAIPINHWVTLGSPLMSNTPKPASVAGDWIDYYSQSDPITWINFHPTLWWTGDFNITWQRSGIRIHADRAVDRTGMEVGHPGSVLGGLSREHSAYWNDIITLRNIAVLLR